MVDPQEPVRKLWFPPGRLPGGDLEVRGLAQREPMPPVIVNRPQGTGDWLFMAFADSVELLADGVPRTFPAPVLAVWGPDQGHWYGWRTAAWTHSWLHARGPALDALAKALALPRGPIPGFPIAILDATIDRLHRELTRPDPDPALARLHLEILLREIVRAVARTSAIAPAPWPEIRRFIDEHHAQRLTLAGLSRRFRLSPQHLCEGFRRWFGVPPIEYLIRLRLDLARMLLADRNRSVASVAAEVGWHDAPHFSRLFRQRCGVSPMGFRATGSGFREVSPRNP